MLDYIEKYGDILFSKLEFNDVDNLVLSILTYINFMDIVSDSNKGISLNEAANEFIERYSYKQYSKLGLAQKDAYKVIEFIKDKKRYKDVVLSNYIYIGDSEKQFSVLKIRYKNRFTYIAFEGTDYLVSGWKEDLAISYEFPVECQKYAIEYINKIVSWTDRKIFIGGHSKGGNLAMVAGMYFNKWLWFKVKKVYNNDGPGFRKEQFDSKEFKKMGKKLVHIVSNYSIVGLLLNHVDNLKVIRSKRKDLLAHSMLTWEVKDNELIDSTLSKLSINFDNSMQIWLRNHNDEERRKLVLNLFDAVSNANINNLYEIRNIRNLLNLVKSMHHLDKETKKLLVDLVEFNLIYCIKNM